jgi:arsenite methyltransferase
MSMSVGAFDRVALEQKVKRMYSDVAANPHGDFHFEMGRAGRAGQKVGHSPLRK